MLELKALLLTQGMHGMVSQVEGLARALKLSFKHQKIKLKPIWNLIPPKFTPISENLLTEKFVCDSKVVISCGRKGDPEYKEHKNETEIQINIVNKA